MGELALAGVDAADEDVEDEVAQLVVVEALALGLGGDEVGDEVLARVIAAGGDELVGPDVELLDGGLDPGAVLDQAGGVELALDDVGPLVQLGGVAARSAHHMRDDQRRIGLGDGGDELALGARRDPVEQLGEERPASPGGSGRRRAAPMPGSPGCAGGGDRRR